MPRHLDILVPIHLQHVAARFVHDQAADHVRVVVLQLQNFGGKPYTSTSFFFVCVYASFSNVSGLVHGEGVIHVETHRGDGVHVQRSVAEDARRPSARRTSRARARRSFGSSERRRGGFRTGNSRGFHVCVSPVEATSAIQRLPRPEDVLGEGVAAGAWWVATVMARAAGRGPPRGRSSSWRRDLRGGGGFCSSRARGGGGGGVRREEDGQSASREGGIACRAADAGPGVCAHRASRARRERETTPRLEMRARLLRRRRRRARQGRSAPRDARAMEYVTLVHLRVTRGTARVRTGGWTRATTGEASLTARAHLRDDRDRVVLPRREGVRAARPTMGAPPRADAWDEVTAPSAWTKLKCRAKVRKTRANERRSLSAPFLFGHVNRMFSYGFGSKR